MSALITSHGHRDVMMHGLLRLCLLKHKISGTVFFIYFWIALDMLGQYIDSCTNSFVSSMPLWSWSNTCSFSTSGMMHLPFMVTPSITAVSGLMSCCCWSLLSGHPAIIKHFNHCRFSSCAIAHCICWSDMHSGMSVETCMASIHMSMLSMAVSLFSLWLCHDSQSAVKMSDPGL